MVDFDAQVISELNYYHCTHWYGQSRCEKVSDTISRCYGDRKLLKSQTLDRYINKICMKSNYEQTCITARRDKIRPVIYKIFRKQVPSLHFIKTICVYDEYDNAIAQLEDNDDFIECSQAMIDIIINQKFCIINENGTIKENFNSNDSVNLINFLFQHTPISCFSIESFCKCKNIYAAQHLVNAIKNFDGELDQKCLYNACTALPESKNVVEILTQTKGLVLDNQCLDIVCRCGNEKAISFILEKGRLPIKREHFNILINSVFDSGVNVCTKEKMEVLILNGYVPDREDLIETIKRNVEIPGIRRFNIDLDKDILERCWDNDFYPDYEFSCIDPLMVELQKLCMIREIGKIRAFCKKNKLVPDRKCMENACSFKTNAPIYEYLKSIGGKPTLKCIQRSSKECKANFLKQIIDDYMEVHLKEKDEKDVIIQNLQNELAQLKKLNGDDKNIQNNTEDKEEYTDKNPDENKTIAHSFKINEQNFETIKRIRGKLNNNAKIKEILGIKVKASFLDIKKATIEYIQNNNLIGENNLISFPLDFQDKIGMNTAGNPIRFEDIDIVVYHFFI